MTEELENEVLFAPKIPTDSLTMSPTMSPIAFPIALDQNHRLVAAEQATRHTPYTCLVCHNTLFLRGGGATQPRAHFYHANPTTHHSSETWLHSAARHSIAQGLQHALQTHTPYPFEYRCPVCYEVRHGDLTKRAHTVRAETAWHGIVPDLLAFSREGQPLFAIEVVVTHPLEPDTRATYRQARLPVFIVQPKLATVARLLNGLGENLTELLNVSCQAPHPPTELPHARYCQHCDAKLRQIKIEVWNHFPCPHCRERMRVLRVFTLQQGTLKRLLKRRWTMRLIDEIAFDLGVRLAGWGGSWQASRAHQCPHCVTRLRDTDIFSTRARTAWQHVTLPERIAFYIACLRCDTWFEQCVYSLDDRRLPTTDG